MSLLPKDFDRLRPTEQVRELLDLIGDRTALARQRERHVLGNVQSAVQPIRNIAARLENGAITALGPEHLNWITNALTAADRALGRSAPPPC